MTTGARDAVAFLTRLPVRRHGRPLTPEALSRASPWFPAVGLLVGGVMGGVHALAQVLGVPPAAAATLAVLSAVLVTGALHEDGLADAADALGAHATRERKLEILRDPRVGAYGALAIVFAVVLAVAALAPLDDEEFLRAALVGNVLARWSPLPQSRLPSAHASGSGAMLTTSRAGLVAGTMTAAAVTVLGAGPVDAAPVLGVAAALTAAGGWTAVRVLGGVSGDTFGAVGKCVEVAAYVTLAAAWTA